MGAVRVRLAIAVLAIPLVRMHATSYLQFIYYWSSYSVVASSY